MAGPGQQFSAHVAAGFGPRIEVVIPADKYRDNLPKSHHATYNDLVGRPSEVHSTGLKESTSQAHQAGSEIPVDIVDLPIAIRDDQLARGFGGTADVVAYAERTGVPCSVIWPKGATRDAR